VFSVIPGYNPCFIAGKQIGFEIVTQLEKYGTGK
jgi:hypothetical protein